MTNTILPPTKLTDWKVLSRTDISPSNHMPVRVDKVEITPNKTLDFYTLAIGPAVMIFPVTRENKLILIRQYKHGAGQIVIEGPAGMINEGETTTQAAVRELEEETGIIYPEEKLISLGSQVALPTKSTHILHGFLALNAEINSNQKFDEHENIEVLGVTFPEAEELILSGEIYASGTVAFLLLIKLRFPELFSK